MFNVRAQCELICLENAEKNYLQGDLAWAICLRLRPPSPAPPLSRTSAIRTEAGHYSSDGEFDWLSVWSWRESSIIREPQLMPTFYHNVANVVLLRNASYFTVRFPETMVIPILGSCLHCNWYLLLFLNLQLFFHFCAFFCRKTHIFNYHKYPELFVKHCYVVV